MLGVWRRRGQICGRCGTHPEDWERDPYAYVADYYTCPGDELLEQATRDIPDHAQGVHVFLRPRRPEDDED